MTPVGPGPKCPAGALSSLALPPVWPNVGTHGPAFRAFHPRIEQRHRDIIRPSWLYRVPLLRGAAIVWIVSDDVGPADAVAVLGGGLEERPFAAADYYRRGLVPKVLLAAARTSPSVKLGISPSHVALNHAVLTKLGVPETALETFGHE
jgi:hypothetical protein